MARLFQAEKIDFGYTAFVITLIKAEHGTDLTLGPI
jgi:hypothetical protein